LVNGPGQPAIADGPAALLPNGHVLLAASPGFYQAPTRFFEFGGTVLTEVQAPPSASTKSCYQYRFLVLPSGQIMVLTEGSSDIEIYAGNGAGPPPTAWQPSITSAPTTLTRGTTAVIRGRQFNGLSQAVQYGDDAQAATNYPLVQIQNNAHGDVRYARTHGHSTMGVATGTTIVSTSFDVPSDTRVGTSQIVVVANGIASAPVSTTVR
jgi:hypothetical protein